MRLIISGAVISREARSCNSCGAECSGACGTRLFRSCCLSYVKKRSLLPDAQNFEADLQLWDDIRNPFYQNAYENVLDRNNEFEN